MADLLTKAPLARAWHNASIDPYSTEPRTSAYVPSGCAAAGRDEAPRVNARRAQRRARPRLLVRTLSLVRANPVERLTRPGTRPGSSGLRRGPWRRRSARSRRCGGRRRRRAVFSAMRVFCSTTRIVTPAAAISRMAAKICCTSFGAMPSDGSSRSRSCGRAHERAADREHLLLAAGEGARPPASCARRVGKSFVTSSDGLAHRGRVAMEVRAELEVLAHREVREDRAALPARARCPARRDPPARGRR